MLHKKLGKNQSYYVVKNWDKYKGKQNPICRSSWERMFAQWLDANPNVIKWSSERVTIPYFDPVRGKQRRYYPDFWMKVENGEEFIVEIKPNKETKPPSKRGKKSDKTKRIEEATYITNMAKFKAAEAYCKKMGYTFKILTEKELFNK